MPYIKYLPGGSTENFGKNFKILRGSKSDFYYIKIFNLHFPGNFHKYKSCVLAKNDHMQNFSPLDHKLTELEQKDR